jgi:hypothetical protein
VGVRVVSGGLTGVTGQYVTVTGASSCFRNGSGALVRRIVATESHLLADK